MVGFDGVFMGNKKVVINNLGFGVVVVFGVFCVIRGVIWGELVDIVFENG